MSAGWVGFALGFFLGGVFGIALMAMFALDGLEEPRR